MEPVDVEKINEVEVEGDKRPASETPLGEPVVPLDHNPKTEEGALLVKRLANETDLPEAVSETHPVETRPAGETTSRKGKRKSNTEKVQCDKCLREFNPAYLSRHICKPVRPASETRPTSESIAEEPTGPCPASNTRPASNTPPIVRETTFPETPEPTAADVAAFLRKQKFAQRAEKMAKYSAAMFGA